MAEYGRSLFLRDYEGGSARIRGFDIPDGPTKHMPASTLKHHIPLGQKTIIIETETDVVLADNGLDEDTSDDDIAILKAVTVNLKRGLRHRTSRIRLRVEYEARPTAEGIELVHEALLDQNSIPATSLTPATPVRKDTTNG